MADQLVPDRRARPHRPAPASDQPAPSREDDLIDRWVAERDRPPVTGWRVPPVASIDAAFEAMEASAPVVPSRPDDEPAAGDRKRRRFGRRR